MPNQPAGYRYATHRWDTDGVESDYEISFFGGYIRKEDVQAYSVLADANGVVVNQITHTVEFLSEADGSATVRVSPIPDAGRVLTIYRDTPKDEPLGDFTNRSALTKENLNLMWRQSILSAAEVHDRIADLGLDMLLSLSAIRDDIDNGGGGGGGGNGTPAYELAEEALAAAQTAAAAAAAAGAQALGAMQAVASLQQDVNGIGDDLDSVQQQAIENSAAIIAEALARSAAILQVAQTAAADLLAETTTRSAQIANLQSAIVSGDEALALQISQLSVGNADAFDTQVIWYYNAGTDGWTNATFVDGHIRPSGTALSPTFVANGDAYRHFRARVRKVGSPTWAGQLYWKNSGGSLSAPVTLAEPSWDSDGYGIVTAQNPGWGTALVQIGVNLGAQVGGDYYSIDWQAIGRPTPGASTAAVQSLQQAMVDADTALALSRDILAAQMRGAYLGNNVQELTTGLIYQERVARADADGALTSSISALQSSMNTALGTITASVTAEQLARVNADNALGLRIDATNAIVEGKASASALATLSSTVAIQGNTLVAQGNALSAAQATLGDVVANSIIVSNGSMEDSVGWGLTAADNTLPTGVTYNTAQAYTGQRALRALANASLRVIYNGSKSTVRAGQKLFPEFYYRQSGIPVGQGGVVMGFQWEFVNGTLQDVQLLAANVQSAPNTWQWVGGVEVPVPANVISVRAYIIFVNSTAGTQYIDDVSIRIVTRQDDANASATSSLNARVGTVEGAVAAVGTALTAVQASVPQEPGNLIPTSDFRNGVGTWTGGAIGTPEYTGVAAQGPGMYQGPYLFSPAAGATQTPRFPVQPGESLELAANMYAPVGAGATGVSIWFYDRDGNNAAIVHALPAVNGQWVASNTTVVVPNNALEAHVFLRAAWANNLRVTQPRVTRLSARAVNTASATSLLDARVTVTENGIASYNSSWSMTLDSNGYVGGIQAVNNGVRSGVTFRMDSFAIVGTAGQPRTEFSDGNWRVYDGANTLRVQIGVW